MRNLKDDDEESNNFPGFNNFNIFYYYYNNFLCLIVLALAGAELIFPPEATVGHGFGIRAGSSAGDTGMWQRCW